MKKLDIKKMEIIFLFIIVFFFSANQQQNSSLCCSELSCPVCSRFSKTNYCNLISVSVSVYIAIAQQHFLLC